MNQAEENMSKQQQWLRGLYMLLFLLIWHIAEIIVIGLAVAQFLFAILSGKGNANLMLFGSSMSQYVRQIVNYLSYTADKKPFPFDTWPKDDSDTDIVS